jgi:hypothetical protein
MLTAPMSPLFHGDGSAGGAAGVVAVAMFELSDAPAALMARTR